MTGARHGVCYALLCALLNSFKALLSKIFRKNARTILLKQKTDRTAFSPEAEDERDQRDEARHHPDVAEHDKEYSYQSVLNYCSGIFTLEYPPRTTTRSCQAGCLQNEIIVLHSFAFILFY